MHIVLLILKIIGMILLGILGLIFLLLLILLCSPLGYSATGCYHSDGNKKLLGNFHYLFHALKIDVMWDGEKVKFRCKLFWFTLKKGATKLGKNGDEEDSESMEDELFHETSLSDPITWEEGSVSAQTPDNHAHEVADDEGYSVDDKTQSMSVLEDPSHEEVDQTTNSHFPYDDPTPDQTGISNPDPVIFSSDEASAGEDEKKGPLDKLNQLIDKVRKGYELITKPSMIKLRNKLIRRVIKLLKHILPRDLSVKGEFGLDDPATMGKIMEVYAFLYAFWGDHFDLSTDFEREHIDVKGRIRGHLVPAYLLHQIIMMGLAILWQKDLRKLIFRKLFHK